MAAYEYWRVEVQFTPDVWTDVTADVDGPIRSTNGATPETTGEPASLSLALHNPGFKYTPGNTSSATALATGMPIRFFEVISDQYIYHFTGFVEFPEIGSVNLSMTQSQTIAVSAVDQLSAWERSSTFVSTLGAHIMGKAGSACVSYWPLLDAALPFAASVGRTNLDTTVLTGSVNPLETRPSLSFQDGPNLTGDDAPTLRMIPGLNGASTAWSPVLQATAASGLPSLAAGQVLTVVLWVNLDLTYDDDISLLTIVTSDGEIVSLARQISGSGGDLRLSSPISSLTGAVNSGVTVGSSRWYQVAIRFGYSPNILELWVDDRVYPATLTGVLAGPITISSIQVGPQLLGSVAHLQCYVGAATDWANADFVAQRAVGLTGLERQTTGDRIKTLARYAGLTDGQLVNVDTGCSVMQAASLAGQTVAQAMYEARDTEQGDLFVDGAGNLTFHDRRTILNI